MSSFSIDLELLLLSLCIKSPRPYSIYLSFCSSSLSTYQYPNIIHHHHIFSKNSSALFFPNSFTAS